MPLPYRRPLLRGAFRESGDLRTKYGVSVHWPGPGQEGSAQGKLTPLFVHWRRNRVRRPWFMPLLLDGLTQEALGKHGRWGLVNTTRLHAGWDSWFSVTRTSYGSVASIPAQLRPADRSWMHAVPERSRLPVPRCPAAPRRPDTPRDRWAALGRAWS